MEWAMRLLVTGGAGFIGSNFVRARVAAGDEIVVLDKLTYAGHRENLAGVEEEIAFVCGDICDERVVRELVAGAPDAIVHFAAESHVDRSLMDASAFERTNVDGTRTLLEAAAARGGMRFCHVSTDEVYGPADVGCEFAEDAPLNPTSPYAVTKADADRLVQESARSGACDAVIVRCTNVYGPYQFPEKLIPLFAMRAIAGEDVPLYGDGLQERDWMHVNDCCSAVSAVLVEGRSGEAYNAATRKLTCNRDVALRILGEFERPESSIRPVADRPRHDVRYCLDTSKIERELGWRPSIEFEEGLRGALRWYRDNPDWIEAVAGPVFETYYRELLQWREAGEGNA
jgi:dTDP-glucose 4,6-dehydratase